MDCYYMWPFEESILKEDSNKCGCWRKTFKKHKTPTILVCFGGLVVGCCARSSCLLQKLIEKQMWRFFVFFLFFLWWRKRFIPCSLLEKFGGGKFIHYCLLYALVGVSPPWRNSYVVRTKARFLFVLSSSHNKISVLSTLPSEPTIMTVNSVGYYSWRYLAARSRCCSGVLSFRNKCAVVLYR